jgi:putative NADPH-quinone reductase
LEEFSHRDHLRLVPKPKEVTMTQTLILLFHPDIARSKANAALRDAARTVPGTRVVDMQARYPGGVVDMLDDGEAEARALLEADRIVLQFPIQWYSTPALLRAWQDAVLTRMYYIHAATEGDKLVGTPLMIAATAGNTRGAYGRYGANHFTMDELMAPLKATALRCGLLWHSPHLVFRADRLEPAELAAARDGYVRALKDFIAATTILDQTAA